MTPKSLLRNKRCVSSIEDFSKKNSFHRVLEDHAYLKDSKTIKLKSDKKIEKVVMCSGKIYFDLLEVREKSKPVSKPEPDFNLATMLKDLRNEDISNTSNNNNSEEDKIEQENENENKANIGL